MALLGQTLINGLLIGGVYALIAVGLTMIFGVMKIVNFAQGEFLMLGMYSTYLLHKAFNSASPYLLIIPVATIMFLIGLLIYKAVIHPVIGKGDTSYILLTVGLSFFLQNVAQVVFSPNPIGIETSIKNHSIKLADLAIITPRIIAFAIAAVFMILVSLFLSKTDLGRAMRATSEDRTIAQMLGINTTRTFMIAFGLGAMFAAIAGAIISPIFYVYPRIGTVFATTVYACVVIGGLGSIQGAFIGGLIIGLVEALAGSYIALQMAPSSVFAVLLIFMLFKPEGLLGGGARKA